MTFLSLRYTSYQNSWMEAAGVPCIRATTSEEVSVFVQSLVSTAQLQREERTQQIKIKNMRHTDHTSGSDQTNLYQHHGGSSSSILPHTSKDL